MAGTIFLHKQRAVSGTAKGETWPNLSSVKIISKLCERKWEQVPRRRRLLPFSVDGTILQKEVVSVLNAAGVESNKTRFFFFFNFSLCFILIPCLTNS